MKPLNGLQKCGLGVALTLSLVLLIVGVVGMSIHVDPEYKQSAWPVPMVLGLFSIAAISICLVTSRVED